MQGTFKERTGALTFEAEINQNWGAESRTEVTVHSKNNEGGNSCLLQEVQLVEGSLSPSNFVSVKGEEQAYELSALSPLSLILSAAGHFLPYMSIYGVGQLFYDFSPAPPPLLSSYLINLLLSWRKKMRINLSILTIKTD